MPKELPTPGRLPPPAFFIVPAGARVSGALGSGCSRALTGCSRLRPCLPAAFKNKKAVFVVFVLVVTGGRGFADQALLWRSLDRVLRERGPLVLWHGGCSGADALAAEWAAARGVPARVWAADWARFGRAAGPLRSRAMLAAAAATGSCGLVAFPGGRGTAAACAAARALGVGVWVRG